MMKHTKALVGFIALATFFAMPARAEAAGLQCAPFARMFSGIQLFGNAYTWWSQALGKYTRGELPKLGSVLVFKATGAMRVGHVATVTRIVSDRIIKVTHANWSHGQVDRDVTVVDASPNNDWSQVKVWYKPLGAVGIRAYPVYGFIYNGGKLAGQAVESAAKALGGDDTAS